MSLFSGLFNRLNLNTTGPMGQARRFGGLQGFNQPPQQLKGSYQSNQQAPQQMPQQNPSDQMEQRGQGAPQGMPTANKPGGK